MDLHYNENQTQFLFLGYAREDLLHVKKKIPVTQVWSYPLRSFQLSIFPKEIGELLLFAAKKRAPRGVRPNSIGVQNYSRESCRDVHFLSVRGELFWGGECLLLAFVRVEEVR